ncbi:MAG: sigma-70 family RNA polymerase sigma factor [Planctomycetota bacterium]
MDAGLDAELQELLARASAGQRDAQNALVRRVHAKVRVIVHRELELHFRSNHRWMLPLFSTSDVVQEVLTDAVRGLRDCEFPGEGAFVRYLATVVRNHLISAVRFHEAGRRDRRRQVPNAEGAPEPGGSTRSTPELAASLAERAMVLREVLDSLPQRHRALVELRLMDGAAFPKIASELGYSSAETARQAFCDVQAKMVLRLRARGVRPAEAE